MGIFEWEPRVGALVVAVVPADVPEAEVAAAACLLEPLPEPEEAVELFSAAWDVDDEFPIGWAGACRAFFLENRAVCVCGLKMRERVERGEILVQVKSTQRGSGGRGMCA